MINRDRPRLTATKPFPNTIHPAIFSISMDILSMLVGQNHVQIGKLDVDGLRKGSHFLSYLLCYSLLVNVSFL